MNADICAFLESANIDFRLQKRTLELPCIALGLAGSQSASELENVSRASDAAAKQEERDMQVSESAATSENRISNAVRERHSQHDLEFHAMERNLEIMAYLTEDIGIESSASSSAMEEELKVSLGQRSDLSVSLQVLTCSMASHKARFFCMPTLSRGHTSNLANLSIHSKTLMQEQHNRLG